MGETAKVTFEIELTEESLMKLRTRCAEQGKDPKHIASMFVEMLIQAHEGEPGAVAAMREASEVSTNRLLHNLMEGQQSTPSPGGPSGGSVN